MGWGVVTLIYSVRMLGTVRQASDDDGGEENVLTMIAMWWKYVQWGKGK